MRRVRDVCAMSPPKEFPNMAEPAMIDEKHIAVMLVVTFAGVRPYLHTALYCCIADRAHKNGDAAVWWRERPE